MNIKIIRASVPYAPETLVTSIDISLVENKECAAIFPLIKFYQ